MPFHRAGQVLPIALVTVLGTAFGTHFVSSGLTRRAARACGKGRSTGAGKFRSRSPAFARSNCVPDPVLTIDRWQQPG